MLGTRRDLVLRYDDKLRAVSEAVTDCLQETSSFAEAVIPSFPLPGLRLTGEKEDVLLPVGPNVAKKLTENARARPTQNGTAWEVDASALEPLNSEWNAMVERAVEELARKKFGIVSGVRINAKLTKLVLHRPGSHMKTPSDNGRKRGVFGTMVLVLPGEFQGAEFTNDIGSGQEATAWYPHRDAIHSVKMAAFYNTCVFETNPVKSGNLLWLEYELSTPSLDQVPRFVCLDDQEDNIVKLLEQYFDEPLPSKKLKLSEDTWRVVNDFISTRHFVHAVSAGTYDEICEQEYELSKTFDLFCRKSNGRYILYLCRMECERQADDDDVEDDQARFTVKLTSPWTRFDEDGSYPFPEILVSHEKEVSPVGLVETARFTLSMVYDDYGNRVDEFESECREFYSTYAFVIQPVSVEMSQWAKLPKHVAASSLENLLETSPEQAPQYARRVLRTFVKLTNRDRSLPLWLGFTAKCNDLQLWEDVILKAVQFDENDGGALVSSIDQFGWDVCLPTMGRIIHKLPLRNRVQFVSAALKDCKEPRRIEQLLDKLTELAPWTDVDKDAKYSDPTHEEFSRIFQLAYSVSISKLASILPRCDSTTTTIVVLPSFRLFLKGVSDLAPLEPLLQELIGREGASPGNQ